MENSVTYTHPTLSHFAIIHFGSFDLKNADDEISSSNALVRRLAGQGFPFDSTQMGADAYLTEVDDNGEEKQILMVGKGESTKKALDFLFDKMLKDYENRRPREYGPIVIAPNGKEDRLLTYYDRAVRSVFSQFVSRTLFADAATMKTSWYGQVNSHGQKKYLEEVITQIMGLKGISTFLTNQFNTRRGEMILTDSARTASLAISLTRQINRNASDRMVYTMGFSCFVQHFGALCNPEEDYYSGVINTSSTEATLDILQRLGIREDNPNILAHLNIVSKDVLDLIRERTSGEEQAHPKNQALVNIMSISNMIVSTFFTEQIGKRTNGHYTLSRNPFYGSFDKTMDALDFRFGDLVFYKYHRSKIESYIQNADRHYRLHIRAQVERGAYVSGVEKEALRIRAEH